jgi:hypothetical protein
MNIAWAYEYLFACLIMGLGIGIDVAIATFMRANTMQNKRAVIQWVVGVSATHTLFPMAGYLLTFFSIQSLPVLTPIIGIIAFSLIAHFLIEELKINDEKNDTEQVSFISFALVLAVSWDALWSGPAKSAQVVGWSDVMIWVSFLLVGIVVTLFCLLSFFLAKQAHTQYSKFFSKKYARKSLEVSQWIQYSVIAYFGLLALVRYTFSSSVNQLYILAASFVLMYVILKLIKSWRLLHFRKWVSELE